MRRSLLVLCSWAIIYSLSHAQSDLTKPNLKIPLEAGLSYKVITEYGGATILEPPYNFNEYHTDAVNSYYAIDLDNPLEKPNPDIVAAAAGTVTFAGAQDSTDLRKGSGYYVKIDHGNKYETFYGHLKELPIVKKGDPVTQGRKIGVMGSTGLSTGTHLHFALYYDGKCKSTEPKSKPEPLSGYINVGKGQLLISDNYGPTGILSIDLAASGLTNLSGSVSDMVTYTASVSGTAVGPIEWFFWTNCGAWQNNPNEVVSGCGEPSMIRTTTESTLQITCWYREEGTYTAKVIARRGGVVAGNALQISLSPRRLFFPREFYLAGEFVDVGGGLPDEAVLIAAISSPAIAEGGTPFQPLSAAIVPFSRDRLGTLNIAFASSQYTDDSDQEIYIKNLDKPEFLRVTNNSFAHDSYPSWSPDGTKLAFVSRDKDKGGDNGIYIMELATGLITLLTDKPAQDFHPSWSPDSKRIVFWSSRGVPGCDSEIYVIDADGSNLKQLTNNIWGDIWPSWSPRGDLIAYESQEHGSNDGDIYLMNPNGGGRQRLVGWTGSQSQPAWSPNGTKLAYISGGEVHAINIDGSDDRVITNTGGRAQEPAWSSDGSQIAFCSDHQANTIGKGGVYIINMDGSSEELLIVSAEQPSWSPVLAQVETEMETLAAEATELDFQDSDVAESIYSSLPITSDTNIPDVAPSDQTSLSVLNLPAPILLSPENGAVGIAIRPDLVWTNSAPDAAYELQVSVTPSFTSPMTFENNGGFDYYGIANRAFPWSWSEYIHVAPLANNTTYYWRVRPQRGDWSKVSVFATVALPTTAVEDEEMTKIPPNYHLARNYPNPFNSETVISYELPEAGRVKLAVYDLSGQEIRILADQEYQLAGQYQAIWNGQDDNGRHVSSGLYLYRLEVAKQFSYTRKMVLSK